MSALTMLLLVGGAVGSPLRDVWHLLRHELGGRQEGGREQLRWSNAHCSTVLAWFAFWGGIGLCGLLLVRQRAPVYGALCGGQPACVRVCDGLRWLRLWFSDLKQGGITHPARSLRLAE